MIDTQRIVINRIDQLPNPGSPEYSAFSKHVHSNLIVDIHTRHVHMVNQALPFSIRSVFNGTGYYDGRNSHYAVHDLNYLLVNDGSTYSYFVDSEVEVNLFSISFSRELRNGVFYYLTHSPSHLLDDPN